MEDALDFEYTGRVRIYSMIDAVVQGVGLEAVAAGVKEAAEGA